MRIPFLLLFVSLSVTQTVIKNTEFIGGDLGATKASSVTDCIGMCSRRSDCVAITYNTCGGRDCWMKSTSNLQKLSNGCRASAIVRAAPTKTPTRQPTPTTRSPTKNPTPTTKSPNPPPPSTNKMGLAWGDWENSDMGQLAGGGKRPFWYHSWSAWKMQQNNQGLEFVPMFHSPGKQGEFSQAKGTANYWNNCPNMLFLNEPDLNGVSPSEAARLYKSVFNPLKSLGKRLGGPSVASNDAGTNWQASFVQQCSGCNIDFMQVHWYGSDPQAFKNYVSSFYNRFKKPIWVTEIGCATYGGGSCGDAQISRLMREATSWMNQQSYIERYSWFAAMQTSTIPNDGQLPRGNALLGSGGRSRTSLGDQYINGGA